MWMPISRELAGRKCKDQQAAIHPITAWFDGSGRLDEGYAPVARPNVELGALELLRGSTEKKHFTFRTVCRVLSQGQLQQDYTALATGSQPSTVVL